MDRIDLPRISTAGTCTMRHIANLHPDDISALDLYCTTCDAIAITSLHWWARKHRLWSNNIHLLTTSTFYEIYGMGKTNHKQRHHPQQQPSTSLCYRPSRNRGSKSPWSMKQGDFQSPSSLDNTSFVNNNSLPIKTPLNNDKIFYLAPEYFGQSRDILQTICA